MGGVFAMLRASRDEAVMPSSPWMPFQAATSPHFGMLSRTVIPAKAGIQRCHAYARQPRNGMDSFLKRGHWCMFLPMDSGFRRNDGLVLHANTWQQGGINPPSGK